MLNLPTALRRALLGIPGPTSIMVEVNHAPAVIIKVTADDAKSMNKRGIVIAVSPQLGFYDNGAVFRLYVEFRDKARQPMAMDSFLNPAQEHDLGLLRQLSNVAVLDFYLFDMMLNHIGQKRIRWNPKTAGDIRDMIAQSLAHNAVLVPGKFDYSAALTQMQEENPI
ncbi:MAG: hypothetical protein ACREO2_07320 [Arenimonas sp.]